MQWQDKVRFLLTTLKIAYILESTLEPLSAPTNKDTDEVKEQKKKKEDGNLLCRGHIFNSLSDRLYDLYNDTKDAKEIWDHLEKKFKAAEEGTKKFLISQYFDLKFLDGKPLVPQIHELPVIVNKLKVLKIELPEAFQVGAIVAKLPPSWKNYRKRILHKNEDYSLEEIQKHIRIEEESNVGISLWRGLMKRLPKKMRLPKFLIRTRERQKKDCKHRKDLKGPKVNAIEEDIIATLSELYSVYGKVKGWWYDTCANVHVTYHKSLFKTFEESKGNHEIQMGNEVKSKVLGKGTINVFFTSGKKVTLVNVLYVPDMNRNLISGDLLGKPGIKAVYESGKLILTKSNVFLGKGYSCEGIVKTA
ncbi:uncharacterized protein LOC115710880 [Cannabis sativa]|uniref:uncharacterized protein LOC115710880 n=1 Tax=Cannabis sativa TaxID=3483 RepID=UPI0011DF059F|nr:uncharacterized protein LOC115710880 [Cannabis sativa]